VKRIPKVYHGLKQIKKMIHKSEVHAYRHIYDELTGKKGWSGSEVFTQNEIQNVKELSKQLGRLTPENIVHISGNLYYVIEAKSEQKKLKIAISEAEDYGNRINQSKIIQSPFITGIAGNKNELFIAVSKFWHNGKWETITENGSEVTSLLSKVQIEQILKQNDPHLKDVEITEEELMETAVSINDTLHENAIMKDNRAKFISAILLALSRKTIIDTNLDVIELVNAINTKVDLELKKHNKLEFSNFIHVDIPSSEDNHSKLKNAIIDTINALNGININAIMNSGRDILGKFYEAFLKYGNGATDLGIVLTPRHITRFAAEVMDIQPEDLVLDPTCGTGGFLVAAFDEARKKCKDDLELSKFKKYGMYGIEEQPAIIALALVNMIFRGDGKNNMIEGNCFKKWLYSKSEKSVISVEYKNKDSDGREPPITKVLMNPPFPKKKTDVKEFMFIDQALKQIENEGILFSVLPYSCMIKKGGRKSWRETLLKKNTIISVITFPPDLFHPIKVTTIGVFIKKGIPQKDQNTLWVRAIHDGFKIKNSKRLPNQKEPNDLETIKSKLKDFLKDNTIKIENIPEFQKSSPMNFNNKELDITPESNLDESELRKSIIIKNMKQEIKNYLGFEIKYGKELSK
jgi:type I restriction enzyme M protein